MADDFQFFLPHFQDWNNVWDPQVFSDFLKTLPLDSPVLEPKMNPSYRLLSDRSASDDDPDGVLNTTCAIMDRKDLTASYKSAHELATKEGEARHEDVHELATEEWEDNMFEWNLLLNWVRLTAEKAKEWLNRTPSNRPQIKGWFDVWNRRLVEQMYGERGQDMLDAMETFPEKVMPVILERFKQKEEEINHCIVSRLRVGHHGPFFI